MNSELNIEIIGLDFLRFLAKSEESKCEIIFSEPSASVLREKPYPLRIFFENFLYYIKKFEKIDLYGKIFEEESTLSELISLIELMISLCDKWKLINFPGCDRVWTRESLEGQEELDFLWPLIRRYATMILQKIGDDGTSSKYTFSDLVLFQSLREKVTVKPQTGLLGC